MADAHPHRLPHDGGDKRKATAPAGGGRPPKRPNEGPPPNESAIEDTATSKRRPQIQEVEIDDIEVMEEILQYKAKNGKFPFNSPEDMRRFCFPYEYLGIGNGAGWMKKMREMKLKFLNNSNPTDDVQKQEFELWKKIWGKHRDKYHEDPNVGSSK